MFKKTGPATIDEYLGAIAEPRKSEMAALHGIIQKAVPALKPAMWGEMIGYGKYHYKYASGREGDYFIIGLASAKQYISVYVTAVVDGEYCAEKHKAEFPKASVGKSCIRFKRLEDIDVKRLVKVLKEGAKLMAKSATA